LFTVITILLTKFEKENPTPYFSAFLIILLAMLFTHKLPILLVIAILGLLIVFTIEPVGYSFKKGRQIVGLLLIACSFLLIQWTFLTDYVSTAYIRLLALIGIQPVMSPVVRTAAVPYDPSLAQKLAVFGFAFVLLLLGGLTWLYLWANQRSQPKISRLLALVSPPVALSIPGLFLSVLAGFYRVFFYATALVSGLVAVGYQVSQTDISRQVYIIFVFAILLAIIAQPVSKGVSPDYMDGTREYLTTEEVTAKEHANTYANTVWMDRYYKDEVVNFQRAAKDGGHEFQKQGVPSSAPGVLTSEFTNQTLLDQKYKHVLLRTDVTVYRLANGLRWTLTWDPVQAMSSSPRYNQVYSNGGAIHYVRSDNN
jgi:hypothetical protein